MNKTFSIDLETSHLPRGLITPIRRVGEPFKLPALNDILAANKYVDIFQLGLTKNGKTRHISVKDPSLSIPAFIGPKTDKVRWADPYGSREVQLGTTQRFTVDDVMELLTRSDSKAAGNKSKLQWYKETYAKDYAFKAKDLVMVDERGAAAKMPWKLLNVPLEEIEKTMKVAGIDFVSVSQKEFMFGKKKDESLASIIDDMISVTKKGSKATLRAWNPSFDLPVILSALVKSGNIQKAQEFIQAHESGLIKIQGIEDDYQKAVWRLIQENPDIAKDVKIKTDPMSYAKTGRPGEAVRNFEEFTQSTFSWSQNKVTKYLSWHKDIAGIKHFAGTDIKASEQIAKIMNEAIELATKSAGVSSIDELFNIKTSEDHMTKAFNTIMADQTNLAAGVKISGRQMLEEMYKDAKNTEKFMLSKGTFFNQAAKRANGGLKSTVIEKAMDIKKYPGLLALAGFTIAGTYIGTSGDDMSLSGKSTKRGGSFNVKSSLLEKYSNDAETPAAWGRAALTGIGIPALILHQVGYGAAKRYPNLFQANITKGSNVIEHASNALIHGQDQ